MCLPVRLDGPCAAGHFTAGARGIRGAGECSRSPVACHGTCAVGDDGPACTCDEGYGGARCAQCAEGYVRDGAIINGEVYCCDSPTNVGGGVSQFGTTFFNAVFFVICSRSMRSRRVTAALLPSPNPAGRCVSRRTLRPTVFCYHAQYARSIQRRPASDYLLFYGTAPTVPLYS